MDLVRSWMGQALRATGAAVVVPVAILLALSLSALGGTGLGGLGALSQVVSGPAVAGSDVSVDDGDSEISDAVTQLAASDPASGGAPVPGGTGPAPGAPNGPGGPTAPGGPTPPPGDGNDPGDGDPGDPGPPGGDPPDPGPPSPPPPPPPEPPGVVEGLGEGVKDVTSGTPVAPTVEDAVDALGDTCARLGCP